MNRAGVHGQHAGVVFRHLFSLTVRRAVVSLALESVAFSTTLNSTLRNFRIRLRVVSKMLARNVIRPL